MKSTLRHLCVWAAGIATSGLAADVPAPPPTPVTLVEEPMPGQVVRDPYRWLENWDDPQVQAWSDAQNARTRKYLDSLAWQGPIKKELTRLITATSPEYYDLKPEGNRVFAMYRDPAVQQPMLVTLDAQADPQTRKALIDPNQLDAKGHVAIDWYVPSPDGAKVAVSLSLNGSEDGTLHVYDVANGREIGAPIPHVQYPTAGGSLAWARDNNSFWYTRYPGSSAPEADQHFNLQVYRHQIGGDWSRDRLVLGQSDGLERVSEVFLNNGSARDTVLAAVQRGDGGEWAFYVLKDRQAPVEVADYPDRIVYATIGPDGALYGISRREALNGKIVKLNPPFAKGALGTAKVIVPESEVAIVSGHVSFGTEDLCLTSNRLLVRDVVGGPNQVRLFDLQGKPEGRLPLPEIAANNEILALKDGRVLFSVATFLRPRYYASWNPKTGQTAETALKVISPISFADAEVVREFAISKDGTKIPLSIIRKKNLIRDGSHPTLLYGYGGYGVSMAPTFAGAMRRVWLDGGGVYAVANLRGGAEYGEQWHRDGMLTKKQNVFDDFAAAAEYLVSAQYTSHDKLSLMGGSNGGLLMGVEITQHPALARAVVSSVGIYDMVRVELDPNGSFNTTEFGTVKIPEQFRALYAYSPYHHVTNGTKYPAVLMLTGATDGRVNPLHSRKFAAALQKANASDHPILLRTDRQAGHGIGSSLDQHIAEQADMLSFFFDQLGVPYPPKEPRASWW
jgi:prolyl oligopeptidase